jgi:hypothetical protein
MYSLYNVKVHFFYTYFFLFFVYHEGILNFIKDFFCIGWDNCMVFILYSVDIIFILCVLSCLFISGINSTWSCRMTFLTCYWIFEILHLFSSVIWVCSFIF